MSYSGEKFSKKLLRSVSILPEIAANWIWPSEMCM